MRLSRSNILFLFLSALAAAPATAASAAQKDETLRQLLTSMRYDGEAPPLTGYSPATVAKLPLHPGEHGHTTPYRSAAGCVAYFYAPAEHTSEVELRWDAKTRCNGKPVSGEGTLFIKRKVKEKDKAPIVVVGVFKGSFKEGALTGNGVKANLSFDAAGKLEEDIYQFKGQFANGVLHGEGELIWTGPKNARPDAWMKAAVFKEGSPVDQMLFARSHPAPGVEADVQTLRIDTADSGIYINQARANGDKPVEGRIFFEGDPGEWKTEIYHWQDGIVAGSLERRDPEKDRLMVEARCANFKFAPSRIGCPKGAAGGVAGGVFYAMAGKPYSLVLPIDKDRIPLRVQAGEQVMIGAGNEKNPMTCNEDLSLCTGTGQVQLIGMSRLYWRGDGELRGGKFGFSRAKLYEKASEENSAMFEPPDPGKDKLLADCRIMSGFASCSEGTLYQGKTRTKGAWTLEGVAISENFLGYAGPAAVKTLRLVAQGWHRKTYASGRWADVLMDDDEITEVGACDAPDQPGKFFCTWDGSSVTFIGEGDSSGSAKSRSERSRESSPPPPRFEPTPVPQRPRHVLPGAH